MRINLIWSDYNIEKSLNHARLPKGHVVLGMFLIGFMGVTFISFGMGIGGLMQKVHRKTFALLGTLFSSATLAGTIILMVIGLAVG